jgi:pyruvate,orthophosphate dikinase
MKHVYSYKEGDGKNKMLLGGKGANLCEMTQIGLNVPPGFVVTTETCLEYLANAERNLPAGVMDEVREHIAQIEADTGHKFGDVDDPLLVSVRSGSAMSMPGMMDTILNLGLNKNTLQGVIKQTGNERFAYDAYRRFIQLYGKVALGVSDEKFDEEFEMVKKAHGAKHDLELNVAALKDISERFLNVVQDNTGHPFPEDVYEQLEIAIKAVFNSWSGKRAVDYRRQFKIGPEQANGTAVNVVAMVFGNMGDDSGTGVGFTRDPGTGENDMYGEYLVNAQGEDVVAGIRTPKPVAELANDMPEIYKQLVELRNKLESHYKEVQDYEYTIEKGTLYCLQTRNGKMNAVARVRTAVEMVKEGMISKEEALLRVEPETLDQLLHPRLDPDAAKAATPLAKGLPASPGAATGKCIFDADRAEMLGNAGEKVILVREETKPEDIHGFFASTGILTSRGGKTSHAAVVARGMGKSCVAGAEGIEVDVRSRRAIIGKTVLHEGDTITIDGSNGHVYKGELKTIDPEFSAELETLLGWADEVAEIGVRANADTPDTAQKAVSFGAQGIGLCRTERMFNDVDRLPIVVDMILANSKGEREDALNKLLPIQREDFIGIFKAMSPRPVTVRLLDPPLHEFLPTELQLMDELRHLHEYDHIMQGKRTVLATLPYLSGQEVGTDANAVMQETEKSLSRLEMVIAKKDLMLKKVRELVEANPMLGHRGVRLGMTHPEIYTMQIRAILEAAAQCVKDGVEIAPEIMVPQVCSGRELEAVKAVVEQLTAEVEAAYGVKLSFKFGSMMEVVRACLRAGDIANIAEFFSFGTNDLTQATFSFSREDAENKFLPFYNDTENGRKPVLKHNPFEALDVNGVGELMKIAVEKGRASRDGLKVGICGEQGGHPESIRFCHSIGLSYVSCSGPRVPIARLAAAQAKLLESK